MKNFKDLVSEVAQPQSPEERRFKDQHTIEVIKHPVAPDHIFTGEIPGRGDNSDNKRRADQEGDSSYDLAYKTKVDNTLPQRAGAGKQVAEEKKSITEILGVNKKKDEKDDESMEEGLKASCGCDDSCDHCGGEHKVEEIGKECSCCGNEIKGIEEGGCSGDKLNAEKKPVKKATTKESDTDSAKTIEPEVQKKKVLKGEGKPKTGPTSVTIKDSNGKTLSMTFKEMLNKVSTEEELLESPQQEIPMMMKQLHFICYATEEIQEYLKMEGQDPEEWWQNKLAEVFSNVKSLYAYSKGDQMVNGKPLSAAKMYTAAYESIEAGKFQLQNETVIEVSEEDATILNNMFDELNETNTTEMYNVLIADEAGYNEILTFAKENLQ
jgi:DNA-directed RNA polymerase subunit L